MKKSRFTESQVVAILQEGEAGVPVAQRLRELEAENAKLKRMYADLALENSAIKEVLNRKL
jgi:putative transposase